jgi:hypothetical protein
MSFCRWSSDNFQCDLYCYADVGGGYTTHVAGYRRRAWVRALFWLTDRRVKVGKQIIRFGRFSLPSLPHWMVHKRIGLPYDDYSFHDEELEQFYCTVLYLWSQGYNVSKDFLDRIFAETEVKNVN